METYVKLSIIDRQFQDAIRNISLHASRLLQTPAGLSGQLVSDVRYFKLTYSLLSLPDRVRIAEWIRKLCGSPSSTCNSEKWSQIRNEYALYLRMMMKHSPFRLVSPFNKPATEYDLPPLSEMLGNTIQQSYTKFPKTGNDILKREIKYSVY